MKHVGPVGIGAMLLIVACSGKQETGGAAEQAQYCVPLGQGSDRASRLAREAVRQQLPEDARLRRLVVEALAQRLVESVRRGIHVSEPEMSNRLATVGQPLNQVARVWLLQIATTQKREVASFRQELEGIIKPDARRQRFRELARSKSIDELTKRRGGSMGFVDPQSLGPCGARIITAGRGALVGPCQVGGRWALWLKLSEVKASSARRPRSSRQAVRRRLIEEKTQAAIKALLARER